jgi:hypothetical protein
VLVPHPSIPQLLEQYIPSSNHWQLELLSAKVVETQVVQVVCSMQRFSSISLSCEDKQISSTEAVLVEV